MPEASPPPQRSSTPDPERTGGDGVIIYDGGVTGRSSMKLDTHREQDRIALLIWIGLIIGFCVYGVLTDWGRSVTGSYLVAGQAWLSGDDPYTTGSTDLFGFLYLPHAAIIWTPLSLLPGDVADCLWRVFTIGVFAAGCWRVFKVAERLAGGPMILLMTILAVLPSLSAMRNGQSTLPMTGLLFLGSVAALRGRWWFAAIWMAIAVAIKPPAIALVLVVWAIFPALWWRMAVTMGVMLLLPFLAQSPEYVLECYRTFLGKLGNKTQPNSFEEGSIFYAADFATFVRFIGIDISDRFALVVRALAGLSVLALSWSATRRLGVDRGTLLVAALGCAYIVLFNPGTENNGYATVAPVMAMFAVMTLETGRRLPGAFLCTLPVLVALNYETMKFVTPGNTVWFCPAVTLVFLGYLTLLALGSIRYPWRTPSERRASRPAGVPG